MVQKRSDRLYNTCSYKIGQGPFTSICSNWFTNRLRSSFNFDANEAIALRWALMKSVHGVDRNQIRRKMGYGAKIKLVQMKLARS
jgi:hypothetical protein